MRKGKNLSDAILTLISDSIDILKEYEEISVISEHGIDIKGCNMYKRVIKVADQEQLSDHKYIFKTYYEKHFKGESDKALSHAKYTAIVFGDENSIIRINVPEIYKCSIALRKHSKKLVTDNKLNRWMKKTPDLLLWRLLECFKLCLEEEDQLKHLDSIMKAFRIKLGIENKKTQNTGFDPAKLLGDVDMSNVKGVDDVMNLVANGGINVGGIASQVFETFGKTMGMQMPEDMTEDKINDFVGGIFKSEGGKKIMGTISEVMSDASTVQDPSKVFDKIGNAVSDPNFKKALKSTTTTTAKLNGMNPEESTNEENADQEESKDIKVKQPTVKDKDKQEELPEGQVTQQVEDQKGEVKDQKLEEKMEKKVQESTET